MRSPPALPGLLAAVLLACSGGLARAATYDESVHGDLADSGLLPGTLLLAPGSNVLRGSFGNGDLDYLAITVPAGHELRAIVLDPLTATGSQFSFIAIQAGPLMTVTPTTAPAGLLGWTHFSAAQEGTDILDDLGRGAGATGFTGGLAAGAYTLWIQELESGDDLGFAFGLEVGAIVPVPPAAALFATGLALLVPVRRARRR